jgi:hypothetical protein
MDSHDRRLTYFNLNLKTNIKNDSIFLIISYVFKDTIKFILNN